MRSIVSAVLIAAIALLATPVAGAEQPASIGGTPSAAFMSTEPGVCSGEDPVHSDAASLMPTRVHVDGSSHLLAYFTSTWSGPGKETELVLTLQLWGGDDVFMSSPDWIEQGGSQGITIHTTGTVMWTFPDVAPGDYVVEATGRVAGFTGAVRGGDGAVFQACALSVFVVEA